LVGLWIIWIGRVRQRDDRKQDRHDARDRTIRGALASFSDVRCWGQSGKHLLAESISPFDPSATSALQYCCAAQRSQQW
jgi:hypothetical protein